MGNQIVILGVQGAGSLAAGLLLESLGVPLGPKLAQAANSKTGNPKRPWNKLDFAGLGDRAFAELGVQFDQLKDWNVNHLPEFFIREFDAQAEAVIRSCPQETPWFLNDPRLCITLPLWEKHFSDPVYVILYRDPFEISRSLWVSHRIPQKVALALWERYAVESLNFTRGKKRILLRISDLIHSPEAAARQLIEGLSQFEITLSMDVGLALPESKLNQALRDHCGDGVKLKVALSPTQQALDEQFRNGNVLESTELRELASANQVLADYEMAVKTGALPIQTLDGVADMAAESSNRALQTWEDYASKLVEQGEALIGALETLHLAGLHVRKVLAEETISKAQKLKLEGLVGADHAIAMLTEWCDELATWNPLRGSYRRAVRHFRSFQSHPSQTLSLFIAEAEAGPGKVIETTKSVEKLLDDLLMGRFPAISSNEEDIFEASLGESAQRVRALLDQVRAFSGQLSEGLAAAANMDENLKYRVPNARNDAVGKEQTIAKLSVWCAQLSSLTPVNGTHRQAVRRFKRYQKAVRKLTKVDAPIFDLNRDRLPALQSAVHQAEASLGFFLQTLEEAAFTPAAMRNTVCIE